MLAILIAVAVGGLILVVAYMKLKAAKDSREPKSKRSSHDGKKPVSKHTNKKHGSKVKLTPMEKAILEGEKAKEQRKKRKSAASVLAEAKKNNAEETAPEALTDAPPAPIDTPLTPAVEVPKVDANVAPSAESGSSQPIITDASMAPSTSLVNLDSSGAPSPAHGTPKKRRKSSKSKSKEH